MATAHLAPISRPSPDDRGSSRAQFSSVKWASPKPGGLGAEGSGRAPPAPGAGAGRWGLLRDSAGRARKGCPASQTGPGCKRAVRSLPGSGRPGGDGKGGRPGAGSPGLEAGSGRGAGCAGRAAAADQDESRAARPPAASGAPLKPPRGRRAGAEMCQRLGEPRGTAGLTNPPHILGRGGAKEWEPGAPGFRPPSLHVTFCSGPQFPQHRAGAGVGGAGVWLPESSPSSSSPAPTFLRTRDPQVGGEQRPLAQKGEQREGGSEPREFRARGYLLFASSASPRAPASITLPLPQPGGVGGAVCKQDPGRGVRPMCPLLSLPGHRDAALGHQTDLGVGGVPTPAKRLCEPWFSHL